MNGKIAELVTLFSFKGSLDPLKKYNQSLGVAIKSLALYAGAIVGAGSAIALLVTSTAEATEKQISLSKQTKTSVESIRELTYIAGQFGIQADTVDSSLKSLNEKIGEAANIGNDTFSRLMISARKLSGGVKDVGEVLTDVRHRFKELNLSAAQKVNFVQSLGLDSNFVQVLDLSDRKFKELTNTVRAFGVVSDKQAEALEGINQNLATMHFGFKALKTQIAISLAPTFKALTDSFTDFISKHSSDITLFFSSIGAMVVRLGSLLKTLAPIITPIAGAFLLANRAGKVFKTGAIGLIILGIDDLIVAFKGGKSAIRAWVKELTGIDITPFLKNTVSKVETTVKTLNSFFHINKKHLTHMQQVYKAFFASFEPYTIGGKSTNLKHNMNVTHKVMHTNAVTHAAQTAKSAANHVNQQVTINVKSTNPKSAAHEIKNALNVQLRNAQSNYGVGGM